VTGENEVEPGLGANAIGKSSLFDAVHWCLYGKTSRSLKAGTINSWDFDKGASVSLVTMNGTKTSTLTRTQSPNTLTWEGEPVDQTRVDQLFIPQELMLHTWYFPQFTSAFIDLKPEQRMEIYTEVMRLGLWDEKSDLAKRVSEAYKELVREKELEVVKWETQLLTLKKTDYLPQKAEWDRQRLARKRAREARIKTARSDLVKARLIVQNLNRKMLAYDKKLKTFNERVKTLGKYIDDLRQKETRASTTVAQLDQQRLRLVKEHSLVKQGVCPMCKQKLPTKALALTLAASLKEINEKLRLERTQADLLTTQIEEKEKELADLPTPENNKLESIWGAAVQEMESIEREIRNEEKEKVEKNPFIDLIQQQADDVINAMAMLEVRREEKAESEQMQSRSAFWIKGFKEIRYQVMEESLRQLNTEVNECLHQLGLIGWEITFSAEKETKSGTVKRGFLCSVRSPHTSNVVPWEAWSGGESQRLRLGAQFGISNLLVARSGFNPSVEFWDEPTQYLSGGGVHDLLAQLEERANRYGRIILLADHRSLNYPFKGNIHIAKTAEGSTIDIRY